MGGIKVNYSVLNQRGTPAMFSDSLANRPAAGFAGRLFIDTDIPTTGIYRDTGSTWELIAGGVPTTPDLQAVTDVGNTTTNNVIMQSRAIVGGTSTQSFHRLIVRDTGTFTTQRESLSIERTHTFDGTGTFLSGPAYGTLAGADIMNLTASITIPNGVSSATGIFSGVTIRPAGFNITQTQGAGLRALSSYRSQLTIEQTAVTSSTITDYAHFFATAIYKISNSNPVTITNNYGLAISDQTEVSTGLTLTNRFGIAQFGVNDRNFFLGRVTVGTSTDAGFQFDVNGTARVQNRFTVLTNGATFTCSASQSFEVYDQYNTRNFMVGLETSGGILIGNSSLGSGQGRWVSIVQSAASTNAHGGLRFHNANNQSVTIGQLAFNGTGNFIIQSTATEVTNQWALRGNWETLYLGYATFQTPSASASLAIQSTTKGFLPPVMTEAQINAIATPAEGLMAYNSTDKTFEVRDSALWLNIPNGLKASATLDFPNTAAQNSSDLTITVTNAALNDMVMLGVPNGAVIANTCYTAFVSAANTVTVRFNNFSTASQNPASGTFRVYVIKN